MGSEDIKRVLQQYQRHLFDIGIAPHEFGPPLRHAAWMIDKAIKFTKESNFDKANRWLGFIQGVLWCNNIFSIEDMKSHNRSQERAEKECEEEEFKDQVRIWYAEREAHFTQQNVDYCEKQLTKAKDRLEDALRMIDLIRSRRKQSDS